MTISIRFILAGAALICTSSALITSPVQGDVWALNVEHEIRWDTASLVGPLEVQLSPGNATVDATYITTVARKCRPMYSPSSH